MTATAPARPRRPRGLPATLRVAVALAAVVTIVLVGLVGLVGLFASPASARPLTRPETRVGAFGAAGGQMVGAHQPVLAGQRRARAPNYDRMASGSCVAAETESPLSGTALARQLGTSGEDLAGIDPAAKVRIPSLTNTAAYRIPDALTDTTLTEVKNVAYQSYTSQIQDFSYYATQTGRQFNLIVRANTVLSGPLEDIVNMTGSPINVVRGLPAP